MDLEKEAPKAAYNVYHNFRGQLIFVDPDYLAPGGVQAMGLEGLVELGTVALNITPIEADAPGE